jgi:hypothetical protein
LSLSIRPTHLALKTSLTYPFGAGGGTEPYAYSVLPGGAGGTINASSGVYTSPTELGIDRVKVTDALGATAIAPVVVGTPLELVCDIIQVEMGLAAGRVYIWDQKINMPTDDGLFVVVGVVSCKPFGNKLEMNSAGLAVQSVNMQAMLDINVISRGPSARIRKEEILFALNSFYAESQQELNSFRVFPITTSFVNLSQQDGAAIPYRFALSVMIQYFVKKQQTTPYFDDFSAVEVTAEP